MVQNSEYNDLTILNAFVHFRLEAIKMGKKKKEKKTLNSVSKVANYYLSSVFPRGHCPHYPKNKSKEKRLEHFFFQVPRQTLKNYN